MADKIFLVAEARRAAELDPTSEGGRWRKNVREMEAKIGRMER